MAHQAHNIPWTLLASNFQYIHANPKFSDITNLYPRWRPQQGREITHFIEAFVRNLELHAGQARRKYDESYVKAESEDVIITDEVAARIAPHIRHNGRKYVGSNEAETRRVKATGLLPDVMRRMAAFLIPYARSHCDYTSWEEKNGRAYDAVEIVKTLLMAGEMDTIFRICAHPNNDYLHWWSVEDCTDGYYDGDCTCCGRGWSRIAKAALRSYICLNMLYCYPSLWDAASGRSDEKDYRHTASYQKVLIGTSMDNRHNPRENSRIPYRPHEEFFGIANDDIWWYRAAWPEAGQDADLVARYGASPKPGRLKIETFLRVRGEAKRLFTASDVSDVQAATPRAGSTDPLNPRNHEELKKYLTYCWVLLLRCDMFARELGDVVPWKQLVSSCVVEFWGTARKGNGKGKMYTLPEFEDPSWYSQHPDSTIAYIDRFEREHQFI